MFLLLAVGAIGCASVDTPGSRLADGRQLADLATRADTTLVLVYDPADCFSCNAHLADWIAWGEGATTRAIALVFRREPTDVERTRIATYRLNADGILAESRMAPLSPVIYVYVSGKLHEVAVDAGVQQALLIELTQPDAVSGS